MSSFQLCPRATVNVNTSGRTGQVLVTPVALPDQRKVIVEKVFIKAVNADGKKTDSKTFTLRNIDTQRVRTCSQLKTLIKAHLEDDIENAVDFDIGYLHNSSVINLRSCTDLQEVWHKLMNGVAITLWCDGLRKRHGKKKKGRELDGDEDGEEVHQPKKKKKNEERDDRIQDLVEELKKKHGEKYTQMQYRIWAEMVVGDVHKDYDIPPTSTMFRRSGGNFNSGRKKEDLTQALTQIASAVTPTRLGNSSNGTSPAKAIEGRSKCYRQLAELKNLRDISVLTDDEFEAERAAILSTLDILKAKK